MEDQLRDKEGFIVLKKKFSELYKKPNYLTSKVFVMDRIYEYDLKSANISALRSSGKIDSRNLDMLESLDKKDREVAVGKILLRGKKDNINIYPIIKRGIAHARETLFRENNIADDEVLAIKNDAVFIVGHKLRCTKFGNYEFRIKGQYAGYLNIDKIEIYYDRKHNSIIIKGIRDEIIEHPDHQKGMIQFFLQVFKYLALDQQAELREYLIKFSRDYKAKKLPYYYYRELNSENIYRTIIEIAEFEFNLNEVGPDYMDIINPVYNYTRYILPIIRQFI